MGIRPQFTLRAQVAQPKPCIWLLSETRHLAAFRDKHKARGDPEMRNVSAAKLRICLTTFRKWTEGRRRSLWGTQILSSLRFNPSSQYSQGSLAWVQYHDCAVVIEAGTESLPLRFSPGTITSFSHPACHLPSGGSSGLPLVPLS